MRKGQVKRADHQPDPRFNDPLVTRFVNSLMKGGKKSIAYNLFYDAIDRVSEQTGENGYEVWQKALENVTPVVEVKSKRIGGSTFQIPVQVNPRRKITLGCNWLIGYSRARGGRSMAEKLAAEIIAASKGEGAAVKKREDTLRMAEANKAFSHFRV